DYIYHVLVASKSKHFNFSTLFVDERLGDSEPNRALLPDQPRTDSYLVYQTAVHYNYQLPRNQHHHHQEQQRHQQLQRQHQHHQQQHQEHQLQQHHQRQLQNDNDDWADEPTILPPTFVYHKRFEGDGLSDGDGGGRRMFPVRASLPDKRVEVQGPGKASPRGRPGVFGAYHVRVPQGGPQRPLRVEVRRQRPREGLQGQAGHPRRRLQVS
ncbi:unnamed protein product, partial [Ixodes persulcatus]